MPKDSDGRREWLREQVRQGSSLLRNKLARESGSGHIYSLPERPLELDELLAPAYVVSGAAPFIEIVKNVEEGDLWLPNRLSEPLVSASESLQSAVYSLPRYREKIGLEPLPSEDWRELRLGLAHASDRLKFYVANPAGIAQRARHGAGNVRGTAAKAAGVVKKTLNGRRKPGGSTAK